MRIPTHAPSRLVAGALFSASLTLVSGAALATQTLSSPSRTDSSPAARAVVLTSPSSSHAASTSRPATTRLRYTPAVRPSTSATPAPVPTPATTAPANRTTPQPAAHPATLPANAAPVRVVTPQPAFKPKPPPVRVTPKPAPPRTTPAPPPAPAPVSAESTFASALLAKLNAQRAAHGLPALRMNGNLIASAHGHNLAMAAANVMSHQLPGEPSLGPRLINAGYHYYYGGENVGWTTDQTVNGVLNLEIAMYNEVPPEDGHRRNILSTNYTEVGIDVVFDHAHGKVWITEDFGSRR